MINTETHNQSVGKEQETEVCLALNKRYESHPFPQDLVIIMEDGVGKFSDSEVVGDYMKQCFPDIPGMKYT